MKVMLIELDLHGFVLLKRVIWVCVVMFFLIDFFSLNNMWPFYLFLIKKLPTWHPTHLSEEPRRV